MIHGDSESPKTQPLPLKTERLQAGAAIDLTRAAAILRAGGTVAFPTETVYGLGANTLDSAAVAKIFVAKGRPGWDPLIVHVDGPEMLAQVAQLPAGDEGRVVNKLIEAFWPGPLTLLLPRKNSVPDAVTAGRSLVGVRMPAHPVALELIRQAGVPIAAPSANRFGHTSPTTSAHVLADLDGRIDAVLDGGATSVGVESTVLEVTDDGIVIYRPGAIDHGLLNSFNDVGWVRSYVAPASRQPRETLPSPGVGLRHYAPRARLVLVGSVEKEKAISRRSGRLESALVAAIDEACDLDATVGVMLPDGWDAGAASNIFRWGPWGDAEVMAQRLFAGLRELDDAGSTVIICPVPEMSGLGDALRDRLEKAARLK
ncbi:MAG: L-threonylcarbamoyladenylate synthase [Acidobacteriaceae bacterium]|nr:L-threonylcarbamoyladenylate synthase [Acidobacteriaceae bacterium]